MSYLTPISDELINEPMKNIFRKSKFIPQIGNYKWNCIKNITPKEFFEHCHSNTIRQHIAKITGINKSTIGNKSILSIQCTLHDADLCTRNFMCFFCGSDDKEKLKKKHKKQLNKVKRNEVFEAIDYFVHEGFIDELNYDQRIYVDALLRASANTLNIKIININKKEL
jgi:hypothetical protein